MTDPAKQPALAGVLAKSAGHAPPDGETLTDHLAATFAAAGLVRRRVGRLPLAVTGAIADIGAGAGAHAGGGDRFWTAVALAALTHDAGKIADGFQRFLLAGTPWGHRHEVVSLGVLPWLAVDDDLRPWVALGVATHHRPLSGDDVYATLVDRYAGMSADAFMTALGPVDDAVVRELVVWLAQAAESAGKAERVESGRRPTATVGGPVDVDAATLLVQAHTLFDHFVAEWDRRVPSDQGLAAVLVQGAVTFADHLSSAHGDLVSVQPFSSGYGALLEARLARDGRSLRPHQRAAAEIDGHLILRAYTGSGKTEAALLWASRQVTTLERVTGGVPRVYYTLPYLASINAMAVRLADEIGGPALAASAVPAVTDSAETDAVVKASAGANLIGVCHSRAASFYLAASLADGEADGKAGAADAAGVADATADSGGLGASASASRVAFAATKAVGRANATRLFRETVRVGTPYQLLRGALAGPTHSSVLVDAVNSVFVLDELHSYDPQRLGYLLATTTFWCRLGGRVAVLSATLPDRLSELVEAALQRPGVSPDTKLHVVEADYASAPRRHRIHVSDDELTSDPVVASVLSRIEAGESVLVVANNVAQALRLFDELAPTAREMFGADGARLLHSRFRRCDRKTIEKAVLGRYRAGLAPGRRLGGVVVATQVVEVSLDVDFDVLFTSGAPLDALVQRFGRVNRLGLRPPADVMVCRPEMVTRRGGKPDLFADGVYPQAPTELAWQHLVDHDGREATEGLFLSWLNQIYDSEWGDGWAGEVDRRRQEFEDFFLDFGRPFEDRSRLADDFDRMFDGVEAVLGSDIDDFARLLTSVPAGRSGGRLLADDLLLPLPHYAHALTTWNRELGVAVVDGEYDSERGLVALRGRQRELYAPGEVI